MLLVRNNAPRGRKVGGACGHCIDPRAVGNLAQRIRHPLDPRGVVGGAKAADALKYGDATNMLSLPIWPFYGILAAGIGLCAVVLLAQALVILREGPRNE